MVAVPLSMSPWGPFIHGWHESARFERVIGKSNLLGLKASRGWTGKVVTVMTHEYVNGARIQLPQAFADWDTLEEMMIFYVALIKRFYPSSWEHRDNPILYFSGLVSGSYRYATDLQYERKLEELYRKISGSEQYKDVQQKVKSLS